MKEEEGGRCEKEGGRGKVADLKERGDGGCEKEGGGRWRIWRRRKMEDVKEEGEDRGCEEEGRGKL